VLKHSAQVRRGTLRQLLGERDCAIKVREFFRMPQWKEKEGLLPWRLQSCIVADLNSFERERESFRILCERARGVSVEGTGELIQNDD
jgi:hypothetical protein